MVAQKVNQSASKSAVHICGLWVYKYKDERVPEE